MKRGEVVKGPFVLCVASRVTLPSPEKRRGEEQTKWSAGHGNDGILVEVSRGCF